MKKSYNTNKFVAALGAYIAADFFTSTKGIVRTQSTESILKCVNDALRSEDAWQYEAVYDDSDRLVEFRTQMYLEDL